MSSKNKDKLAAVLLNHWFVQQYGLSSGRLKKRPGSSKYKLLSSAENSSDEEVSDLARGFSAWNIKHFILNIEHLLSQDELVKTGALTYLVKGINSSGLIIEFSSSTDLKEIIALKKALAFNNQIQTVSDIIEPLSDAVIGMLADKHYFSSSLNLVKSQYNTQCLYTVQNSVCKLLNAFRFLFDVKVKLSELNSTELADIMDGRANLRLENLELSNGRLSSCTLRSEETEDSRITRRARERLEEAMRKRTLHVQDIIISSDSKLITFHTIQPAAIEDTTISVELDVVTSW